MNDILLHLITFFAGILFIPALIIVLALVMPEDRPRFGAWRWASARLIFWFSEALIWDADRLNVDVSYQEFYFAMRGADAQMRALIANDASGVSPEKSGGTTGCA